MDKIKVLFLSANPVATPKLQLDEEIRQIGIKLRAAEYRDAFDFVPRFAARLDNLLPALLEHKPEIVHFSGSEFRVLAFLGGDEVGIISSYLTSS